MAFENTWGCRGQDPGKPQGWRTDNLEEQQLTGKERMMRVG